MLQFLLASALITITSIASLNAITSIDLNSSVPQELTMSGVDTSIFKQTCKIIDTELTGVEFNRKQAEKLGINDAYIVDSKELDKHNKLCSEF